MSLTNIGHTPEKVYFDLQISNLNNINQLPTPLNFIETRNTPFLIDPQEYYMSIIRFYLETPSLPIFTPSIQYNQGNVNLTIYSVTLTYTNPNPPHQQFNQQTYVNFSPQDLAAPIPEPPNATQNGLQNNNTGYYYIYSFQYWIYLINQAFTSCFNSLSVQITGAGLIPPTNYPPVMTFDTESKIAILNVDQNGYSNSANQIQIFFNLPMYQLFSSFPGYLVTQTSTLGKNIKIQTDSFGESNLIPFPPSNPSYNAIQIFQEYSTTDLWNPVMSIVFTSSTLPIVPTQVSSPILIVNGNTIGSNGNNSNIAAEITDFVSNGSYKPNLIYEPSAQYRLVDMTGNRPIYTLDLSVCWKDRLGNLNSFRLSAGSAATLKILFTKKSSINYKT